MSNANIPTELGTLKISKLLKMYAVPGIIAMTASSLYNMVDSIYIGHIKDVGSMAISGLAVTFPLMNLSAAIGTLVGVGAATMISVLLGQKNYKVANKVLANEVTLNIIFGVIFSLITMPLISPILYFFGASENTLPFAKGYMMIILAGNVITHLYFGLNALIRAAGNPKLAMGLTIFTIVLNSILDPIMIFAMNMGIQGAALATVISQICALVIAVKFFLKKDNVITLKGYRFDVDWRIAKNSLAIGLGPFLMNAASCIVALFINQQLRKYGGDLAIGAYGIINRISFMFIMVNMGLNQGMQPIAGYNYGARQYSRVKEVFKLTATCATIVTCVGFIISEVCPNLVVSIFTSDPELKHLADKGLRILNLAFPIIGFQMVSTNFFQCLGMVRKSIFLSLSRQLLFLVPLVYFLPSFFQEKGVWMSFPISDTIASICTACMLISLFRKFSKLNDGDDPSILGSNL